MISRKVGGEQLLLLFALFAASCSARPELLQEQNLGYYRGFLKGAFVGVQSVLSLAGYYEDEVVKKSMEGELVIDEEDEENQTEVKVVGLGLGRTGITSVTIALEILGYTVGESRLCLCARPSSLTRIIENIKCTTTNSQN